MKVAMQKPGIQDGVSFPSIPCSSPLFQRVPLCYSDWRGLEASTPLWIVLGAPSLLLILQPALLILDPVDSGQSLAL